MFTHRSLQLRRLGLRLLPKTHGLPAVLVLAALALPTAAIAGQFQTTTISPATQTANVGTPFSVNVVAAIGSTPAYGIQAFVTFDKTKLQVVSVTTGASSPWTGVFANTYDNLNGTLTYDATGGQTGGTVTAATITFNPIAAGNATIGFANVNEYLANYGPYGVNGLASGASVTINAVLPTQTLTILGGSGPVGTIDPYTDASRDGGVTWQPAYRTGAHPWGFINGTNSWINFDPSPFVGLNSTTLYRVRFSAPADAVNPRFNLQLRADNYAVVTFNGQQIGENYGESGASADLVYVNSMQPGENTIYLTVQDWGGWVGFNFRIDVTMEASQPPTPVPSPSATPPPVVASGSASGTYGSPFSYTISASNSPANYTATGLPAGLSVNTSNGTITGTPTQTGSFTVNLSATNTGGTGTGTLALTIGKASATVTLGDLSQTYDGNVKSASATTHPAGLNVLFNYVGARINAGSYAVQGVIDNPNYTGSSSDTLVIAKANAAVSVSGYTGTYDAAAHGASGTATGAGGVNLSGSLNLGSTFANVPGGTAHWTFAGGTNYNDQSGDVAIVIKKADATVSVAGYAGTYDGAAHGATGSATGVGGVDLSAGLKLGATYTNVPGGTASWTFTGGTNYNNTSGTAAIVINKANATVVVTPYNVEYDGIAHSATVASITGVNGETGVTVGSVTLNTTHTNVGTYSADSWSFSGANYNSASATVTDVIKDTTPPVIASVTPSSATLWPPNHQMVAIKVTAVASDLVGVTSLKIVNVTSSEPDNGLGDGDTANDTQITGALTVNLRAERSGNGDGRTYTITVEARDAAGNASTKTCEVSVAKSQGKK